MGERIGASGGSDRRDPAPYMEIAESNTEAARVVSGALGKSGPDSLWSAFMDDNPQNQFARRAGELGAALRSEGLDFSEDTFRPLRAADNRYRYAEVLQLLHTLGTSDSSEARADSAKRIAIILRECQYSN